MSQTPKFDLGTSEGGRGYLAQLFKDQLKRHDFTSYINERLAADFACVMSAHIEEQSRRDDELRGRLHLADELIREAWRLMDGQAPKTADWHLLASHYINNPDTPGVDIKAIGLIDTARVDLYERLHSQEAALVPYFDDSVGQWFIPPADDDHGDGQHFATFRQAIDSLSHAGVQTVAPADPAQALRHGLATMITRETIMTALRAITDDLETLANDSAIARHKSAAAELRALFSEAVFELAEPVEPYFYHAECDDPDYSGLYNYESEALTQIADHGGTVTALWNVPPSWKPGHHAQVAVVPDGYCLMPTRLTAENGAKGLLIGEFNISQERDCPECATNDDGPDEDCDICNGNGHYEQSTAVCWDTIKDIYQKAVGGLSLKGYGQAPAAGGESQ